jgi:hypothetical protein
MTETSFGFCSLDGIEVRLVNALAGKMNFSAHFVLPSDGTNWGWVHVDGALSGMLGMKTASSLFQANTECRVLV